MLRKVLSKINPKQNLDLALSSSSSSSSIAVVSKRNFYYPDTHHIQTQPHVLAKRIIKCIGARLREQVSLKKLICVNNRVDPQRWQGVPFTFKTNWVNDIEGVDIRTCIHVHDALEREFTIDIDDRKILIMSIQEATDFIMRNHKAL